MAAPILTLGSKGKLVGQLQKFLNLKGKLPKPLEEDEVLGTETRDAVRYFQKARHGELQEDGIVGPHTAAALAKLIGSAAAGFAKALGAADLEDADADKEKGDKEKGDKAEADKAAAAKAAAQTYFVTYNGKSYALTKDEFEKVNKGVLAELKRTAVLAAQIRAESARILWDTFNDINKDQYIVSWFVSLAGPKLPDESMIKAGEQAYQQLKTAVDSGDCRNVVAVFGKVGEPINTAYITMTKYKDATIDRSGTWLKGLEFTRDKSFDIVATIATAEMGGTPVAGAVAGGGSELVKAAAGEFGKYLAGTSKPAGDTAKDIAVDVAVAAVSGGVGAFMKVKGDKLLKGVADSCAKKVAGQFLKGVAKDKIADFLAKRLEGAAKGALEGAIKNAAKAIKGNMTPTQFFEEVGKEMAFGSFLGSVEDWIESKKFGDTVYAKMNSSLRSKLFGKLTQKEAVEKLNEVIKDKGTAGVKKAIEIVIDKAKGDEKAEDLGEAAAIEFANSGVKALDAEIAKAVKNK